MTLHAYLTATAALVLPILMLYSYYTDQLFSPPRAAGLSCLFTLASVLCFYWGHRRAVGYLFSASVILMCLFNIFILPAVYQSRLYRKNPVYQSLRRAREISYIRDLPTYHIGRPDPRDIWDIGKIIQPLNMEANCNPTDEGLVVSPE